MGLPLADYRTTRSIRESPRSQVYEAVSERDGRTVVAKVFDIEEEADEDRVQHEFELIRTLDFEGVVRAEELRRVGDQLILVLEHVPGLNLAEFANGEPLALPAFYPIATQIADILGRTHAARVIHRDIKPTNILIHAHSGRVQLVDFGISVLLESERRHIYDNNVFVGTLPYISPEQTGRTSRAVDFRSDLYSLGVSFYELLTARLPFESLAPLELIHAHLAREPVAPHVLRPELPMALSRLVMKLLAKAPERRYQTATGLAADLRRLQAIHESGLDDPNFELASEDRSTTLRLPHQLYGRDRERAELSAAFAEVAATGERQTVALVGPTGVGKSALVRELETEVAGHGGYMIRGRFDNFLELPYAGFAEAFTALFEQLLTESDARLERWRRQLLDGLGALVGVLAELSPTLELILGSQLAPAQLDAAESRNRVQIAIERLLKIVCADGRPVVLVLEDLHGAGQASARLLEALVHGRSGPLLVVVTLRPDELREDHPLLGPMAALAGRPQARVLTLGGLSDSAIEAFVADALPGGADVTALARTIARKTDGVPLFINQLLTQLHERGLLRAGAHGWEWDQAKLDAEPIPDDAVAMVSARLEFVSPGARTLIRHAACIGARFDLARLNLVCDHPRAELTACLIELEDAGLLARVGAEYQFCHQSVHQAAQRGLDDEARRRLRWTIGRELLTSTGGSEDRLFEIVDHLNAGAPADPNEALRLELAALNLRAGARARDSGAYDLAHAYLVRGIALAAEHRVKVVAHGPAAPAYLLVFHLHFTLAYVLALAGRREQADHAFAELLGWTLDDRHYGEVVARRVRLLWQEARNDESITLGLAGLARLGVSVPRDPALPTAMVTMVRAWRTARRFDRRALEAMPRCDDPRDAAIIAIVAQVKYPAFATSNSLFLLLAGLHVQLTHTLGYHPSTPIAISDLSLGVSGKLAQVGDSIRLLELACELARAEPTASTEARILAIGGAMSLHRGRPFADIIAEFEPGYRRALEVGEFGPASFIGGFSVDMQVEIGTHLRVLSRRCRRVARDVGRWCPNQMRVAVWMTRGLCVALLGPEVEPEGTIAAGEVWDLEPEMILANGGARTNYCVGYIHKALIELVFNDSAAALATCARGLDKVETIAFGAWYVARACVLTCAAYFIERLAGAEPRPEIGAIVQKRLRTLERWAADSPTNYDHYCEFIQGLRAAVQAQPHQAARLLNRAWQHARKHGCRWIEGLAAEQLAALFEREELSAAVDGARQRVWEAYAAWGADAKLEQLREAHPQLFGESGRRELGRDRNRTSAGTQRHELRVPIDPSVAITALERTPSARRPASTPPLDLAEVLRSVGAITEDLRLEEVIARVLNAAMTNIGADRGLLVLEQGGELALVANADGLGAPNIFAHPPSLRDAGELAPSLLINFVIRTGKSVVLDDARDDLRFAGDPYLDRAELRSVLAMPLVKGERRLGVLVLENRLTTHGFSATSLEALRLITSQAASTLENAQLYSALRRSEARWRSLVDGAPDLIALFDDRGRVVFRNQPGPLKGTDETDHPERDGGLRPESAARWDDAVAAVLSGGERLELELEFVPPTGPVRWYAVRLAPIDFHGALSGETDRIHRNAVAVATDISARKHAEAEKRLFEGQLRQQQRLESVGTLASGVAHEINNPIQGIMNYADLIYANSSKRELVEEFAGEIIHESNRVATIVRNLLAFSRQDATAEPAATQLSLVVQATLSLVHAVLRRDHITVTVDAEPNLPLVRCRAQQIQQVVMNLVTNARDALNQRYGDYDERKRIEIRVEWATKPDTVRVSVRDTGPGITAEVLPRIFDPFFTTKGRNEGTGLGLAVSHGIVLEHGGELLVETEVGVGSCFMLELHALSD